MIVRYRGGPRLPRATAYYYYYCCTSHTTVPKIICVSFSTPPRFQPIRARNGTCGSRTRDLPLRRRPPNVPSSSMFPLVLSLLTVMRQMICPTEAAQIAARRYILPKTHGSPVHVAKPVRHSSRFPSGKAYLACCGAYFPLNIIHSSFCKLCRRTFWREASHQKGMSSLNSPCGGW